MTNKNTQSTEQWQLASAFFEKHYDLKPEKLHHNNEFQALDEVIRHKVTKLFTNKHHGITLLDQPITALMNASSDDDLSGLSIDSYQLIELIAHGGMASVYRGRKADTHTQKDVAIKLIPTDLQTDKSTSLFKQELKTLAKLHHPNIISLHHGDVSASGIPYLVMELVEKAQQIDQYFIQHNTSFTDIVSTFITLCEVIAYAHHNNIIHQDIKPSNVLIDEHGHLLVVDFGVAALAEVIPEHHAYTLSYASPEQTHSNQAPQPTYDIYALSSLLIKCLSRCEDGQTGWQIQAMNELNIDSDLRFILNKGIDKNSSKRYTKINDLAMDLSLWLRRLPISELKNKPFYRLRKTILRHPATTALASLFVISMLIGLIFYHQQFRIAHAESIKAQQIKNILIEAIDQNDPDVSKGNQLTVRDMLKQVELSHAENPTNDTVIAKELYLTLGQAFNKLGDYDSTEQNIQKILDLEPLNVEALLEMAELKTQQKQVDAASVSLSKLDQIATKLSTQNTIRYHLLNAKLAIIRSQFELAEDHFSIAQKLAEATNQIKIKLKVMAAHTDGLNEQHKTGAAIKKIKNAIMISDENLGEIHSQTLTLKAKLAETYLNSSSQDVKKGSDLFELIIPQQKSLLGDNHPNVAKSLYLNATAYRSMNNLSQARVNAEKALSIVEQQLGEKHLYTGKVLMSLGAIYLAEKDILQATEHARMAVVNHANILGEEHPETLQYKTSYVSMLIEDQRYEEALELLLQIHPIQTEKLGPNHRGTLFVDIILSKAYTSLGRLGEGVLAGERCHENALKSATKTIMEVYCAITLENAYYMNRQFSESAVLIEQYQSDPLVTNRPQAAKQFKDHSEFNKQSNQAKP